MSPSISLWHDRTTHWLPRILGNLLLQYITAHRAIHVPPYCMPRGPHPPPRPTEDSRYSGHWRYELRKASKYHETSKIFRGVNNFRQSVDRSRMKKLVHVPGTVVHIKEESCSNCNKWTILNSLHLELRATVDTCGPYLNSLSNMTSCARAHGSHS